MVSFIFFTICFILFLFSVTFMAYGRKTRKRKKPAKVVHIGYTSQPEKINPIQNVAVVKPKPIFKKGFMAYHVKPRSMTEQELYLYKLKPNLQWWVDHYGKHVFSESIENIKQFSEFYTYYIEHGSQSKLQA